MPDIWIRIRIRLRTAYRAIALFTAASDLEHAEARHELTCKTPDEAAMKRLRNEADEDADSAQEFKDGIHRAEEGREP